VGILTPQSAEAETFSTPTINLYDPITGQTILDGHKVSKSDNAVTFGLKVRKDVDIVEDGLRTEIYIGITDGVYQKVTDFTVNGKLNTDEELITNSGVGYTITLNKASFIPVYVNDFKIKIISKDALGGVGEKVLALNHYAYILADWSLDSIKDSIANDSSGNCINGIIHGSSLAKGIVNYAHYFDGENDYINIPKSCFNNLTDWTFEAWVKPEASGCIYSEGNPLATLVIEMRSDFSLDIGTWHEGRTENWNWFNTGANTLTRNEWNHLVITLADGFQTENSGTLNCFVNGTLKESGTLGSEYNLNSKYAAAIGGNIGVRNGEELNPFQGYIDGVTLYGCTLTDTEVQNKYYDVLFLDNIRITNRHNDETSHPCTFGSHFNKIEFDLRKTVNELVLELDMPSNIKVAYIEKTYKYDSNEKKYKEIETVNAIADNNKIILNQHFTSGRYRVDFLVSINQQLIVKTQSYSDEKMIATNYESEEFEFELMDF
jgi:hypothetical protein